MAAAVSLFASIDAALLTPLPYPRAQDLYSVRTYFPSGRFTSGLIARAELLALAQMSDAVQGTSGAIRTDAVLTSGADVREVVGYSVSSGFFEVFGVPPALGRTFGPSDYVQGAPTQVVLSDRLWKNVFGSDSAVVGRVVSLGGAHARVIGVTRAGFDVPVGADLWINVYVPDTSIGHSFEGFARLRPRTTVASLRDRMASAMAALGRRYPDQDDGRAYELRPLLDDTVGDLKSILVILFLATGLLLVLAIVNVTNLMLARLASRRHEFALRAALGANRWQLVSIVVGESLAVGVAAGILGLAASWGIVHLLPALGISRLPRLQSLHIGGTAVAFGAVMSLIVGLVVAAGPGVRAGRMDLAAVMNEVGRGVRTSRRTRRLLSAFVAAEIAVAIALLAGAGRLTRSYENLQRVDPGFQPDGRLVVDLMLPLERYSGTKATTAWWNSVSERLRAIGATHVAAASSLPLVEHEWDSTTFVDLSSFPNIPPDQRPNARWRRITPGFFQTMGIPLLTGRDFDATDSPDSPFVAIVNQAFVRRFLGDRDPLREKLVKFAFRMLGPRKFVVEDAAVVGVVADVKYASLAESVEPIVYVPMSQSLTNRFSLVLTTADGHPERIAPQVRAAILGVDPLTPTEITTLPEVVAGSLGRQRIGARVMIAFGVVALLLALVGVFSVVAYTVTQRVPEMAIRHALGATSRQVFAMVVGETGVVAAAGAIMGLALAWWMGRLMTAYVFDVPAGDIVVLAGSAGAVAVVALAASVVPARRAATVAPAEALKG